jgi:uncharacterized protein YfaS (alpha-2-macroglobulin family)
MPVAEIHAFLLALFQAVRYRPEGVYVFEYSARVQLRGQYQTGAAQIQCRYAPEFNSHSEGLALVVN